VAASGIALRRDFLKPGNRTILNLFAPRTIPFGRASLSPKRAVCYARTMTGKKTLRRFATVEAWPEAAQAELAPEIDAELGAGKYRATLEELAGIGRGLKDAREGRFATEEQVEELFKKHRPATE
jgi:hypothetical protein